MTGHWPVVNDSDFAQPVPSDSGSDPTSAASSMPASTSGTPRICSIWSFGSPLETSTVSQPNDRACASRSS